MKSQEALDREMSVSVNSSLAWKGKRARGRKHPRPRPALGSPPKSSDCQLCTSLALLFLSSTWVQGTKRNVRSPRATGQNASVVQSWRCFQAEHTLVL